jgi:hypothetical protein
MKYLFFYIFIFLNLTVFSQDLEDILDSETKDTTEIVRAIFKGTRIVNGHSIETRKKGEFEFLIQHRFGRVNSGFNDFFGLDDSNIRFGLEYAVTDDLTIAIGRSSFEKTFDVYAKYRILKQKKGKNSFPISLTYFGSISHKTLKDYDESNKPTFSNRLFYSNQLLIAKKFSEKFSIQLSPTIIHFNTVKLPTDDNTLYVLGFGSRYKISKRVSINAEYFHTFNPFNSKDVYNNLSIGVDIQTGGHVFQLILTNSRSLIEKAFIAETTGDFFKGDIHFGFNISRLF